MIRWYKLDGKTPVLVEDVMEWQQLNDSWQVGDTYYDKGRVRVSTAFLGLDHGHSLREDAEPVLFETMIFGGKHDDFQLRCCTWDEAEKMHSDACGLVGRTIELDKVSFRARISKNLSLAAIAIVFASFFFAHEHRWYFIFGYLACLLPVMAIMYFDSRVLAKYELENRSALESHPDQQS